MFRGSVWFRLLGWDVPTIALQMLQFDALTLGEHEFYRGPLGVERVLKTLSERQSAALVLCNGDFSRESTLVAFPLLKSLVLTRGNVRVGLIGYVRDDLNATSQPGPTLGISSDLECVRQQADAMRAQGVDVVIAFGGGNLTADRRIAQEVINVSVLVTKYEDQFAYPTTTEPEFHKPVAFDYPMKVARKDGSQGYIVASNKFVQFIGMVNVTVDSITRKVVNVHGSPILLDESIPLGM
ncbi:protein 5NUC-like [Ixodes scapularis]|uniref:protein 5NUC-like n=1 Tax=Ixodes scapularis TaxID=6945 RepID=UPI001A9D932F|nr:protein 5NUC-like [Ixodes scapularis]